MSLFRKIGLGDILDRENFKPEIIKGIEAFDIPQIRDALESLRKIEDKPDLKAGLIKLSRSIIIGIDPTTNTGIMESPIKEEEAPLSSSIITAEWEFITNTFSSIEDSILDSPTRRRLSNELLAFAEKI